MALLDTVEIAIPVHNFIPKLFEDKKALHYGYYGDDILGFVKSTYKEEAETYGKLFTRDYLYECRGKRAGSVLFVGKQVKK